MAEKKKQKESVRWAVMNKADIHAVIDGAKDESTLQEIGEDLLDYGYDPKGISMKMIENRIAVLAGEEPPHVLPAPGSLPPVVGNVNPKPGR